MHPCSLCGSVNCENEECGTKEAYTSVDIGVELKLLAAEYRVLVEESCDLIYRYRNGEIPEKDCWGTIQKRDNKKRELLDKALEIKVF